MGALTIKNYSFETRIWELQRLVFPNIFSGLPSHLLLLLKNNIVQKIFPFNKNDIISNKTRFSCSITQSVIKNLQCFSDFPNFTNFSNKFIILLFSFILLFLKTTSSYRSLSVISYPCLYIQFIEQHVAIVEFSFTYYNFIFTPTPYKLLVYSNTASLYNLSYVSVENVLFWLFDEENFFLFQRNFNKINPDLFYLVMKTFRMYIDSEVEEEEEVLIDKPNRSLICFVNKINVKYVWFLLQSKKNLNTVCFVDFFDINKTKQIINIFTPFRVKDTTLIDLILDGGSRCLLLNPFGLMSK